MLGDINDHLNKIQPSGDQRVNMWCDTCHRGRPRPMTLNEELGEQYRMKGLKPALDRYADLKKKYYGRGAYDFGETALNDFGYQVLENKDAAGAIQVFKLNAEAFPQSGNVWNSLAEAYMKAEDLKIARKNYEKALKLNPEDQNSKESRWAAVLSRREPLFCVSSFAFWTACEVIERRRCSKLLTS
jgi:tetratricopeptide (TPR) repeat protein